jgi:hypothetical protein
MINSDLNPADRGSQDEAVDRIVCAGAGGAVVLAGIATAIVVALWFAFYLLVFVPRATAP